MAVERTLVLVKPDGVARGLTGELVRRYEARGLVLRAAKLLRVTEELAGEHYEEHREKPFFGELIRFITGGPTFASVLEGENAIAAVRATNGATNPLDAAPGTIRGDFALANPFNLVHGSDAPESAAREIALWFADDELV
jgi:nucleoside-diphosphate kinase